MKDFEAGDRLELVDVVAELLARTRAALRRAHGRAAVEAELEKSLKPCVQLLAADAEVARHARLARIGESLLVDVGREAAERLPKLGGHLREKSRVARLEVHLDEHARLGPPGRDVGLDLPLDADERALWQLSLFSWILAFIVQPRAVSPKARRGDNRRRRRSARRLATPAAYRC